VLLCQALFFVLHMQLAQLALLVMTMSCSHFYTSIPTTLLIQVLRDMPWYVSGCEVLVWGGMLHDNINTSTKSTTKATANSVLSSSTLNVQTVGPETEPVEVKVTQLALKQQEVTDVASASLDNLLQSNSFKVYVHKGIKQSQLHAVVAAQLSSATGVDVQDIQKRLCISAIVKNSTASTSAAAAVAVTTGKANRADVKHSKATALSAASSDDHCEPYSVILLCKPAGMSSATTTTTTAATAAMSKAQQRKSAAAAAAAAASADVAISNLTGVELRDGYELLIELLTATSDATEQINKAFAALHIATPAAAATATVTTAVVNPLAQLEVARRNRLVNFKVEVRCNPWCSLLKDQYSKLQQQQLEVAGAQQDVAVEALYSEHMTTLSMMDTPVYIETTVDSSSATYETVLCDILMQLCPIFDQKDALRLCNLYSIRLKAASKSSSSSGMIDDAELSDTIKKTGIANDDTLMLTADGYEAPDSTSAIDSGKQGVLVRYTIVKGNGPGKHACRHYIMHADTAILLIFAIL
jgi:hypothetical protein